MAIDHTRPRSSTRRPRVLNERQSDLDGFVQRLKLLGATPDEIAATIEHWDDFTDDYGPTERAQMIRWSDKQILTELAALRAEYREHTT